MLNCKEASQIISQSLDRPLSFSERLQLKVHLLMCDACRQFKRQLVALQQHFKTMVRQVENDENIHLSAQKKADILEKINSRQH